MDSLTHLYKTDLKKLKDNYHDNLSVISGQHPHIMSMYFQKEISIETFTILSKISNVYDYWEEKVVDKFVARDIMKLSKKYYPFLDIDQKKFSKITKEHFF